MAQALPIMTQYFSQVPIVQALANEGKKVSQVAISKMIAESSGWKNYYDIVVDMTPEEKQQAQQNQMWDWDQFPMPICQHCLLRPVFVFNTFIEVILCQFLIFVCGGCVCFFITI